MKTKHAEEKSKFFLPFIFFLVSVLLSVLLVVWVRNQATQKITEGDWLYFAGKLPQALKSYELAQKFWPLLYYDTQLNQKIQLIKDERVRLKTAPALTVFFKNTTSVMEIQAFMEEIKKITGVREIKYTSKEDAFKIFTGKNPELIKLASPSLLPASADIYLSDPLIKEKLNQVIKTKGIIQHVIIAPSY